MDCYVLQLCAESSRDVREMAAKSAVLSTNRGSPAGVDSNIFAPSLGYKRGWRIMLSILTKGAELQTNVLRGVAGWAAFAVRGSRYMAADRTAPWAVFT